MDWSVFSGVRVGSVTDLEAGTGVTVLIAEEGGVLGMEVRGGAASVLGLETSSPLHLIEKAYAIVLSGGSAYGLESVFGVMKWLEEKGIGFDAKVAKVPIVAAGVVFDLRVGSATVRPNKEWGYLACQRASPQEMRQGNVGAGAGVTVGKVLGFDYAMKGGLGIAFKRVGEKVNIGAVAVVNAWGDIVDYRTGKRIAGAWDRKENRWLDSEEVLLSGQIGWGFQPMIVGENTTLVCVITDAGLTKIQANKAAHFAQNGLALAIRPAHSMYDGDVAFVLSVGNKRSDFHAVCVAIQQAVAEAVVNAVLSADSLFGIPSARSLQSSVLSADSSSTRSEGEASPPG
ncbi:MAG: P1 family peptidase [Armatimonadetes bacterium]|nr:P1 family peptidase [Armatimonadota bacterium]MDW8121644.1 P1 family peptidase [Armatimonadota bacterium]